MEFERKIEPFLAKTSEILKILLDSLDAIENKSLKVNYVGISLWNSAAFRFQFRSRALVSITIDYDIDITSKVINGNILFRNLNDCNYLQKRKRVQYFSLRC